MEKKIHKTSLFAIVEISSTLLPSARASHREERVRKRKEG